MTLHIYNALGEHIETLLDGEAKTGGYHAVVWDGRNNAGQVAASGLYFVKLTAGSYSKTMQAILVK